MLQLHLSDQQLYCPLRYTYIRGLKVFSSWLFLCIGVTVSLTQWRWSNSEGYISIGHMNPLTADHITKIKQSTLKPYAYFMEYTYILWNIYWWNIRYPFTRVVLSCKLRHIISQSNSSSIFMLYTDFIFYWVVHVIHHKKHAYNVSVLFCWARVPIDFPQVIYDYFTGVGEIIGGLLC